MRSRSTNHLRRRSVTRHTVPCEKGVYASDRLLSEPHTPSVQQSAFSSLPGSWNLSASQCIDLFTFSQFPFGCLALHATSRVTGSTVACLGGPVSESCPSKYSYQKRAFCTQHGDGLENRDFYCTAWRPGLGPTQPPIQWVPGAPSPGVKRQECEAGHSPPASAEFKNGGAIPPLPMRLHGA
jgi:hypothetical protein